MIKPLSRSLQFLRFDQILYVEIQPKDPDDQREYDHYAEVVLTGNAVIPFRLKQAELQEFMENLGLIEESIVEKDNVFISPCLAPIDL